VIVVRHHSRPVKYSLAFITLSLLLVGSGCIDNSPTTTVFIVPNGFSGLFLVAEDRANGVNVQRKDGEYFFEVPESGKLIVKRLKLLTDWHREVAHYKDGRKLPTEGVYNDNEIRLFTLPYVAGKGVFYFVGSRIEFERVAGMSDFEKLPLGTNISELIRTNHSTRSAGEN
jgi:hypothetical protein